MHGGGSEPLHTKLSIISMTIMLLYPIDLINSIIYQRPYSFVHSAYVVRCPILLCWCANHLGSWQMRSKGCFFVSDNKTY